MNEPYGYEESRAVAESMADAWTAEHAALQPKPTFWVFREEFEGLDWRWKSDYAVDDQPNGVEIAGHADVEGLAEEVFNWWYANDEESK